MSTAVPSTDTMAVKVNGREVVVPRTMPDAITGRPIPTTMIQACERAGVDVPHYCYHPKLPVAGNCRMCLVEFGTPVMGPDRKPVLNPDGTPQVRVSPRPAIACATPISPGMEIYTDTPGVRMMRQGVLEFLLVNHPLDCPICDQAGECKLQEYSVDYGQFAGRFVEPKVHKPKQVDLGPRIMLDDERCILCTRCIRFTRDIIGDDALGILHRGSYNTLSAYPGRSFDHNYTLNTVDLCPVGALTSKDFRFQMRVWFLKETKSLCTGCGTGCNVVVGSREGRVLRYVPRENDAVNGPWMCDEGRLNYRWIGRADRIRHVARRIADGRIETDSWAAARQAIATVLQQAKPGSVAIVASARQTNEELYLLARLARRLEAVTDVVPRPRQPDRWLVCDDRNPNTAGARLVGFAGVPPGSRLASIASGIRAGTIRVLIVFGEDVTRLGIGADLLASLSALVACEILPNETTARAHWVLPGCAHAEKRGSFTNVKGRVQRFLKAVEPPGDARPEMECLVEWLAALGELPEGSNLEQVFNLMAREVPAFQGLSWAGLGDTGATVKL